MTKNKIIAFALVFLFLIKPVFAETLSTTPRKQQVKTQVKEEIKSSLTEVKQKRIQVIFDAIKNGLSKRHDALLKIKDKIAARITKNPMNKDTASAKTELAKFDAAEIKYQSDLAALNTKFDSLKNSDKPSSLIKDLKDSVNLVKADLDNIKKILVTTVTALAQAPKLSVTPTK